jgi:hypothetical protein
VGLSQTDARLISDCYDEAMADAADELWSVATDHIQVDANALAKAVERAAAGEILDTRSRWLIRDSVEGLRNYWGDQTVRSWLTNAPLGAKIEQICREEAGATDIAFPSLSRRIVDTTKRETVLQFLAELSDHVHSPARLDIGGAVALILVGHLSRRTDDIDIVNEVPAEIRVQHALLDSLTHRYRLKISHFQSHYLPNGWENRVHSIGSIGKLQVFVVDEYDVFIGKLFSARSKDLDDLREILPRLDSSTIRARLIESSSGLRSDAKSKQAAEKNWFVLFREPLPQ